MFEIVGLFSGNTHLFMVSSLVSDGDTVAGAPGMRQIQLVVPNPGAATTSLVEQLCLSLYFSQSIVPSATG